MDQIEHFSNIQVKDGTRAIMLEKERGEWIWELWRRWEPQALVMDWRWWVRENEVGARKEMTPRISNTKRAGSLVVSSFWY